MSEVLLVSLTPVGRGDAESMNSTRSFHSQAMGSSYGSLTRTVLDDPKSMSLSMPIEVEEEHCRKALLLECQFERLDLAEWRIALREQMESTRLRQRAADIAVQEALLHHRMERFAYIEQRYGKPLDAHRVSDLLNTSTASTVTTASGRTAPPKTIPKRTPSRAMRQTELTTAALSARVNATHLLRALLQDELFARELLALEETHAWIAQWSALPPPTRNVSRPNDICVGKPIGSADYAPSMQIERVRCDTTAVCDEAEALSFALDDMHKGDTCVVGPCNFPEYPVGVMRAATAFVDKLRRRLYRDAKRRKVAERALQGANQRADEQSERVRLLQCTVDATEEAAAAVAAAFQLRLPAPSPSQSTGGTYAERVLHELPNSLAVLQRQLRWQEERAGRELRDREAVLEMIFVQTSRLAALLRQMLGSSAPAMLATGGEVSTANVAGVLESVIASVVALRDDGDCGFLKSSSANCGCEEEMKRTIAQMQRRIDKLVAERGKAWGTGECVSDEDSNAQVLLMVMRQLQEVRGEKLALEIAHENRHERRPVLRSPSENRANQNGAEDQKDPNEWVQTVHKLTEDNALLREEVRLEQEARQALAAQLKVSERFVRELQRQCRRLRQSGRMENDACEVIQGDKCGGSDSGESTESDEGYDDDNDDETLENDILKRQGKGEGENLYSAQAHKLNFNDKADHCFCAEKNFENDMNDSASPLNDFHLPGNIRQIASSASSLDSPHTLNLSSPFLSPEHRAAYLACLRDHRRFATALRVTHGLSVCTIAHAHNTPDVSSILAGCAISIHALPRHDGGVGIRRLAVLYPLPSALQAQVPLTECIRRVRRAVRRAVPGTELIDLRSEFAHAGKYLRGSMDLCVSPGGRFVYALASADCDALARLCAPAALDIPPERRFRFAAADKKITLDELGWCGSAACAWAVDAMQFESPAEQQRFERHIRKDYAMALRLSAEEMRRGAGGCVELLTRTSVGKTARRIFMSVGAYEGLSAEHRAQLTQFYGAHGIATVSVHNIERETAAPLRRLVVVAQWHGDQSLVKPPPKDLLKAFGLELDKR